ncbi:MAG: hypothetical protein EOP05_15910, partial [Proteobacteria bacterium]
MSAVSSSKPDGGYKAGTVIPIQVTFSETVSVGGAPTLTLETGAVDRSAIYFSGSGTSSLTFNYTVQAGDSSLDLDYVSTSSLVLNSGSIRDGALNNAELELPASGASGSLGLNKNLVIDTESPVVVSVTSNKLNGAYRAGEVISVQVRFSKSVSVAGTPILKLETGTQDRDVNYASGSGSNELSFDYTVQAGDTSLDLDYESITALSLNGGTIQDSVTNDAVLTLVTPGSAGSLGFAKALIIDTIVPTAPGSVLDGTWTNSSANAPAASWSASTDVTSGVHHYEYAIGTSSTNVSLLDWTDVGLVLAHARSGLNLTQGTLYYVRIRAVDAAGNISADTVGDGFRLDNTVPNAITSVDDGLTSRFTTQSTKITWSPTTDNLSGILRYEVALGSFPGGDDIFGWQDTTVALNGGGVITGLSLVEGSRYYASVRAVDGALNFGVPKQADGWLIGWIQQAYGKGTSTATQNLFGS